jgi:hypothetical protein
VLYRPESFEPLTDERCRPCRFSVQALAQAGRAGRYSLFTGDLGVALFAASCLEADPRFPVLDGWD